MLASCKKNLVHFPDVFAPLISPIFRGGAFFLTLRGCPAPRALNFGEDPQFWKNAPPVNSSRAQGSLTAQTLDFGEGPSILEK